MIFRFKFKFVPKDLNDKKSALIHKMGEVIPKIWYQHKTMYKCRA